MRDGEQIEVPRSTQFEFEFEFEVTEDKGTATRVHDTCTHM